MTDLPHRPTLFIDRNSGGRIFRDLIANAIGVRVVLHDEHFRSQTVADEVWLKEIGDKGWIIITGDAATIGAPLFLAALKRSRARVFILNGLDGATREGKAQCVIDCYETIISICQKREPPLFWRINKEGGATHIDFKHKLGILRKHGKTPT
jgi:PIN like domain